jgi:hypothetical protein
VPQQQDRDLAQLHRTATPRGGRVAARRANAGQYCTDGNVLIVPNKISDHIPGKEQIAPGALGGNGATTLPLSYFDLVLAFIGLTFGLPSALPGLFFQNKDGRHPRSQAD